MKSRDRHAKQEVRRAKKEKKSPKQEVRGQRSSGKPGVVNTPSSAAVRDRVKRSGFEAVKLHIESSGHTGRTSRSATSVMYPLFKHI